MASDGYHPGMTLRRMIGQLVLNALCVPLGGFASTATAETAHAPHRVDPSSCVRDGCLPLSADETAKLLISNLMADRDRSKNKRRCGIPDAPYDLTQLVHHRKVATSNSKNATLSSGTLKLHTAADNTQDNRPHNTKSKLAVELYKVVAGDTASSICSRFMMTLDQFSFLNGGKEVNVNKIEVGQILRVVNQSSILEDRLARVDRVLRMRSPITRHLQMSDEYIAEVKREVAAGGQQAFNVLQLIDKLERGHSLFKAERRQGTLQ